MNRTKLQEGTRALYGNQFLTRYFRNCKIRVGASIVRPYTDASESRKPASEAKPLAFLTGSVRMVMKGGNT